LPALDEATSPSVGNNIFSASVPTLSVCAWIGASNEMAATSVRAASARSCPSATSALNASMNG
jgi:hypothetical protein